MTITPTASDGGSGLSALEVSKDGGAYAPYTAPVSFGDGKHTYQFKATDYAGNVTETPPQTVKVDTTPPAIEMPAEISLGDTLEYELSDEGSGLSTLRIVIEDDEERYPKVTGEDSISGKRLNDSLLWDGRFKDGSESPSGTYYITLKVHDVVGNESRRTCAVTVNFLSMFQSLPAYVPPTWGDVPTNAEAEPIESPVTEFGGTNNITTGSPSLQTASTGGVVVKAMDAITQLFTTPPAPAAQIPSTGNILWGAAAAAATAAFLAEIKKRKEEEKKESWKQHNAYAKLYAAVTRNSRAKQAKAQAESNQRMENKMAKLDALDEAKWTASQVAIAKREEAEKQKKLKGFLDREHRDNPVAASAPPQGTWLQNLSNTISPLLANISSQWDNFSSNITTPSNQKGPLLGSEERNSLYNDVLLFGSTTGVLLDQVLFGGKITTAVNQASQSIKNNPTAQTTINIIENSLSFAFGAASQYMNDMSFGLYGNLLQVNWENGSDAFQTGREVGRTASTIQGVVELFTGAAAAAFFLSSMPPTGGGVAACGATTGGICLIPGVFALAGEAVMAGAGVAVSLHGAGVLGNNAKNPLQTRGNSGADDPTLHYGSNKGVGKTRENADLLRKNMKVGVTPGEAAHHIVPSTHPHAQESREILQRFGIDINQAGNGVLLPESIHSGLANNHVYMDAVLNDLRRATSRDDAIKILQDIGEQLLDDTYPRARK